MEQVKAREFIDKRTCVDTSSGCWLWKLGVSKWGSGYGYGSGDGDSDGNAAVAYWSALTSRVDPSCEARKLGAVLALWKSDAQGRPANGGSALPVQVGAVQEVAGPLSLCQPGTLHATFHPGRWHGERLWIVALHGEVAIADDKLGALKREILAEVL